MSTYHICSLAFHHALSPEVGSGGFTGSCGLPPVDSGYCAFQGGHPTSRQLQPTIPVEMGVLQPDVYCLLQQQLLVGPGLVNHRGLLPLDWVVVLPCMLCKGRLLISSGGLRPSSSSGASVTSTFRLKGSDEERMKALG